MSTPVSGEAGSGQVVAYTLGQGEAATLETISFVVATDGTAGVHSVRLSLVLPTIGTVAQLDDLNEAGPSQTNHYTYGLGLNGSACTLPTGISVTDALPWTELQPGAEIILEAINAAGVEIAGDTFSDVLLQFAGSAIAPAPVTLLPISLLPGSVAA